MIILILYQVHETETTCWKHVLVESASTLALYWLAVGTNSFPRGEKERDRGFEKEVLSLSPFKIQP